MNVTHVDAGSNPVVQPKVLDRFSPKGMRAEKDPVFRWPLAQGKSIRLLTGVPRVQLPDGQPVSRWCSGKHLGLQHRGSGFESLPARQNL